MIRDLITSMQNPKLKSAIKLRNRQERNATHLFLIEGYRELKRAVDAGVMIKTVFICPFFFLGVNEEALITKIGQLGGEVIETPAHVFEKLSYRDRPDGLVAVAVQMQSGWKELFKHMQQRDQPPFLIVAESIEKPGNLGTILRSADAAGVDGVIVCDRCTDIYNPNVVRSSVGTVFTLPVVEAGSAETLAVLRDRGITVVAATPSAKMEFTETALDGPIAIAVGTEQLGLSCLWMDAADIHVKIPMKGVADSLNVATATTLLMYEVVRQRWK